MIELRHTILVFIVLTRTGDLRPKQEALHIMYSITYIQHVPANWA
jgi:hypothetical protein